MSSTPFRPDPVNCATQRDEDAQYYRQVLHELIAIGTDLARALHRQAAPESNNQPSAAPAPAQVPQPDPTIAFDRIARTLRRTIALARKITDPARPAPAERSSERRLAARKRIIREVEDTIQRRAEGADAEVLQAEFYERLETIDCEDDIANLPIAEIVALIRRDLGLAHLPGTHPWKRRKPQDVMDLYARAAKPRPAPPGLPPPGTVLPRPFAAPPPRPRTSTGPPPP